MKNKFGDRQRLLHVLKAIDEIAFYVEGADLDGFMLNSMMQYACIKQIEIIGEATNHISTDIKSNYPEISWPEIIAMRHILVHEYFGVDLQLIWQVISEDLPKLKAQTQQIIDNLPPVNN